MSVFEYQMLTLSPGHELPVLNREGAAGWELVAVVEGLDYPLVRAGRPPMPDAVPRRYYFKRTVEKLGR